MLKKIVSLLLTLLLALGAATSALAMAVSMSAFDTDGENDTIVSIAAAGSTLYILYQSGRLVSRPVSSGELTELGEATCTAYYADAQSIPTEDGKAAFDKLFVSDGQLLALLTATGEMYRVLDDQGLYAPEKLPEKLDTSVLVEKDDDYSSLLSLTSLFAQDGFLYYTGASYSGGYSTTAGRINLKTGAAQVFNTKNLTSLVPYQDGKVLAMVYDASALYGNAVSQDALSAAAQYGVFDPEKDALESTGDIKTENTLGGYAISGLCYGANTLYYRDGSRVMGLDITTGESRISAYTGEGMYGNMSGGITLYAEGYYVAFNYEGLSVYKLDSENLKNGALTVFGEFGSNAHKSFTKNYPDIPVDVSGEYTSDIEKLTQAMVSESQPYDVLMLNLGYMPVERLQQKGYCADLSAYSEIVERVSRMYPQYADAMTVDGKLYGVPVDMNGQVFGVNMERWEELGLTEDDLPKTILELYDFAANWVYDYGEDNPDLALFDYNEPGDVLFSLMLSQYMAYTQWKGESLRFDTELFRKLVDAFSAIDFDEIKSVSDADEKNYWNSESLFSLYMSVGYLNQNQGNIKPLYLSMQEGEEPFIAATVNVLIINPKTKRMDDAVLYVKNYLDNLEPTAANITLFPEHNDPVENPSYESQKKQIEKEIASARERLESAGEENKADLQSQLTQMEESLAEWENYRYNVSAEAIASYREEVAPLIFVQKQNVLYNADNTAVTEINKLLMQYLEGAITSEQMVEDLDKRVKLMELEDM